MPKYIPIHTNTCSLIQYVPIRPLHIPDGSGSGRAAAGRRIGGAVQSIGGARLLREVPLEPCRLPAARVGRHSCLLLVQRNGLSSAA